MQDEVFLVPGDAGREAQLLVLGKLEDQHIVFLIRAQGVPVHLVVVVLVFGSHCPGLGIAAVIEAQILKPGHIGKPAPLNHFRELSALFQIQDADFLTIAAVHGNSVGQKPAPALNTVIADGHGAIRAPPIGIQNHLRLTVQALLAVEHRLVLQTAVVLEEIPRSGSARQLGPGIIPQLQEALLDGRAGISGAEELLGELVLPGHPGRHFGIAAVFQPAIGIRDQGSVKVVNHILLTGLHASAPSLSYLAL